jgi:tetratricopeptide (TPR) repeat protein
MYKLLISELVILLYSANKRQGECLELAQFLQAKGEDNLAMSFASIARMSHSNYAHYSQKYRHFIKYSLESESNQIFKATKHYNLANSFKGDGMCRESLFNYISAARLYPKYLQEPYWWAEVGGSLFGIGKLKWAETAYRKAIELGEKRIHILALLGDTLFYQGKFLAAQEILSQYIKEQPQPFADSIIKLTLVDVYLANFEMKIHNIKLSEELLLSQEEAEHVNLEIIKEAIELNPISTEGWRKLAVNSDEPMAAVWAAVASKGNIDEWSWAILSTWQLIKSQNSWSSLLAMAVCAEANSLFGKSIQRRIQEILKTTTLSPEKVKLYLEQIESLIGLSTNLFFTGYNPKIELRAIFNE